MKFSASVLLLLPALASAFAPAGRVARPTSLSAAPAKSFDDDLEKTRAVIASRFDDAEEAPEEPAAESEE
eukprot:CAMPEP_0197269170 /NCGR_PEP_ID=MMETSP1432-20130617/4755_1 /TAXON_ID=44447 /ORGANISM="Pseudo-nitzschia delicatissima, Strain UNC1205" /LENGTH=69 /DNA_ID=CAMNT_0042734291 /DNA_START=47 /DNA_END=256 /DNA_ORIENTATION=+